MLRGSPTHRGVKNPESRCIINHSGLHQCYGDFSAHISEYDSVICTNSLAAISLIKHLNRDGIRVPEDIQVVTFGLTRIAEAFKPAITAVSPVTPSPSYNRIIQIFRYLYSNYEAGDRLKVFRKSELKIGETTKLQGTQPSQPVSYETSTLTNEFNFYSDPEIAAFAKLELLVSVCNEIDFQLIRYALQNYSYEKMADKIHISTGTVFYRLQRLIQNSTSTLAPN